MGTKVVFLLIIGMFCFDFAWTMAATDNALKFQQELDFGKLHPMALLRQKRVGCKDFAGNGASDVACTGYCIMVRGKARGWCTLYNYMKFFVSANLYTDFHVSYSILNVYVCLICTYDTNSTICQDFNKQ